MNNFLKQPDNSDSSDMFDLLLKSNEETKTTPGTAVIELVNKQIKPLQERVDRVKNESDSALSGSNIWDEDTWYRSRSGHQAQLTMLIMKFDLEYIKLRSDSHLAEELRHIILINLEAIVGSMSHQLAHIESRATKLESVLTDDQNTEVIS